MDARWKPIVAVHGVLRQGDDVLLVSNCWDGTHCFWTLPGGGPEGSESLREALAREFSEETSLKVQVGRLLWVTDALIISARQHFQFYSFEIASVEGEIAVPAGERLVREAKFHVFDQLAGTIYWADLREPLCNYLREPDSCLRYYVYSYEQTP